MKPIWIGTAAVWFAVSLTGCASVQRWRTARNQEETKAEAELGVARTMRAQTVPQGVAQASTPVGASVTDTVAGYPGQQVGYQAPPGNAAAITSHKCLNGR